METLHNARWLAGKEVGRRRGSYLTMAAIALVAGLGVTVSLGAASGTRVLAADPPSALLLNLIFLMGFSVLPRLGAWLPKNRESLDLDAHLVFLRRLPLGVAELVAGRVMTILFSVAVVAAALLLPPYLLSEALRAQLGIYGYLLFAAVWVCYALALESVGLFLELGLGGRAGFFIYMALLFVLGGFAGYTGAADPNAVVWTIELIQSHGPLLGLPVFAVGFFALALSGWSTAWRLKTRDLPG